VRKKRKTVSVVVSRERTKRNTVSILVSRERIKRNTVSVLVLRERTKRKPVSVLVLRSDSASARRCPPSPHPSPPPPNPPNKPQLTFNCPSIERIHVANFPSLLFLGFAEGTSGNVTDLRLSNNTSMLPQSVAQLILPNLKRFEVRKMAGLNDLQLGELLGTAHATLSSLRIAECRGLGDVLCWLGNGGFRPISLVELGRVGPLFTNDSFR
jgi:hypothetical protein